MKLNKLYRGDCLEVMKSIPDKSIDLVLTDPPYGIKMSKWTFTKSDEKWISSKRKYKTANWDDKIPEKEYFDEIYRISKNQIIFWGNYFTDFLEPSRCWLIWHKRINKNQWDNFSDCELAWTSFNQNMRIFEYGWVGFDWLNNPCGREDRIHPTQKPKELMKWCIENYSQPWETILDCFAGSGTTWVAAIELWRNYILIEKDEDYCNIIEKRLKATTPPLFVM